MKDISEHFYIHLEEEEKKNEFSMMYLQDSFEK
jgi:hypothetical protein